MLKISMQVSSGLSQMGFHKRVNFPQEMWHTARHYRYIGEELTHYGHEYFGH